MRAIHPNNVVVDDVPSNDQKCGSLINEISISEPYPNPFNDVLHLGVIAPYQDHLTIQLYDNLGQDLGILFDDDAQIGLNSVSANVATLADGIYTIRFTFRDQVIIRQVMKAREKK